MTALQELVAAELAEPVDPRVSAMAEAIAAQHGAASRAVLFYGSCLQQSQLEGLMLDFYLIVSDYAAAYDKAWLATANRRIPPNVFPFAHDGLAAKYAVLSEADFAALNRADASTVSVWARFAQPTRLVWAADDARNMAIAAVAQAAPTLLSLAAPLTDSDDPLDAWRTGFTNTYACELRAERNARPGAIVDASPERYRAFAQAVGKFPGTIDASRIRANPNLYAQSTSRDAMHTGEMPYNVKAEKYRSLEADAVFDPPLSREAAERRWKQLRRNGKVMSVARLAKASFTFAGGIDYLAWKISRHSGAEIVITPWQRRWPLLGAVVLVPRLLMKGAIR